MLLIILSFLSWATLATSQTNYCDVKALHCKEGTAHIGCDHKGVIDPVACNKWKNVKVVKLGPTEINMIVDEHNKKRDETARGKVIQGATATRVCTMVIRCNFMFEF